MTEQEKMLAGKIYDSSDETLLAIRTKAHKLCQTYNQTADTEEKAREQIMRDLIPDCAKGVYLQGPIYFDYGKFTTIGENTFANFNFTVLSRTMAVTITGIARNTFRKQKTNCHAERRNAPMDRIVFMDRSSSFCKIQAPIMIAHSDIKCNRGFVYLTHTCPVSSLPHN